MLNKLIALLFINSLLFASSFNIKSALKSSSKSSVLFYPGKFNKVLPSELYSNFLNLINKNDINVYISQNEEENLNFINNKLTESNNCIVSHSFSANDALNLFSKSNDVDKIVLIDPLDDEFIKINMPAIKLPSIEMPGFPKFDFQKMWSTFENTIDLDKLDNKIDNLYNLNLENEETKYKPTNKEIFGDTCVDCDKDPCECDLDIDPDVDTDKVIDKVVTKEKKVLILRTSESNKWRFFPSVPPIGIFNLKNDKIPFDSNEIIINNYGHFDILDDTWANLAHKTICKGSDDRTSVNLDKFRESLSRSVNTFLNHE